MKRIIELINPVETPSGILPARQELEFTRSLGKIYARVSGTNNKFEHVETSNIKRLYISSTTAQSVLEYLMKTKSQINNHGN